MAISNFFSKKVIIITISLVCFALVTTLVILIINNHATPKPFNIVDDMYLAQKISYANGIEKAAPAVVNIQTNSKHKSGLGSGVIINSQGYILTNYHVIKDTKKINVKLADKRETSAQLIGSDPQSDLAVIKINLPKLPAIKLGNSAKLQVGDLVLAIGNPLGLNNSVSIGIISAITKIDYLDTLDNLIQTDAAINPGSSGGALIDSLGNLVGINTAIVPNVAGSQGIAFAIPINIAKDIMQQIISHGKVTRGWIGAHLSALSAAIKSNLKFKQDNGIYVQDTVRYSPAAKAGILPGDVITKINNNNILEVGQAISLIANMQPKQGCQVEVFRQGKLVTLELELAAKP